MESRYLGEKNETVLGGGVVESENVIKERGAICSRLKGRVMGTEGGHRKDHRLMMSVQPSLRAACVRAGVLPW